MIRRIAFLLFLAALLLAGCAQPAPRAVFVPTTAAVQKPLAAAQAANARAVAIIARAQKTGLAAGSPEFAALVKVELEERIELFNTKQALDQLAAQLLTAKSQADALAKHDAAETQRADVAEKDRDAARADAAAVRKSRWHWRFAFAGLCAFGVALVSLIGVQLQEVLRKAEKFAAHEALVTGEKIGGAALKVPRVAAAVLKIGGLLALA